MHPGCWMLWMQRRGRASIFHHPFFSATHLYVRHYLLFMSANVLFIPALQTVQRHHYTGKPGCVVWSGSACARAGRLNGSATASQENKSVCDWQQRLTEATIDVLFIRMLLNPVQMKYSMDVLWHKQAAVFCAGEYGANKSGGGKVW